jgi:subtilisin family serine protease
MRRILPPVLAALAIAVLLAAPLAAQLQLPRVPGIGGTLGDVTGQVGDTLATTDTVLARNAQQLLRLRERTLGRLLRRHGDVIERDGAGELARKAELLAIAPSADQIAILERAGFRVLARDDVAALGIAVVRLAVPQGMALPRAQTRAGELVPDLELSADHLHFEAGQAAANPAAIPFTLAAGGRAAAINVAVGVIDGAVGKSVAVTSAKGFARGAPAPSDHGSAVASLLLTTGVRRVWVADVYGTDPAGGNALAIAKALGWLTQSGCKVVTISLVGPRNALVERAVAAARKRGVVVVAAIGNDGPAAPLAYPASYHDVLAITGVDREGRALIEAGRALHLDYAAPGAEVLASDAKGRSKAWRGTSFATPLAAARVAAAIEKGSDWRATLYAEARDLGKEGPDDIYGRGLLCEGCGRTKYNLPQR